MNSHNTQKHTLLSNTVRFDIQIQLQTHIYTDNTHQEIQTQTNCHIKNTLIVS